MFRCYRRGYPCEARLEHQAERAAERAEEQMEQNQEQNRTSTTAHRRDVDDLTSKDLAWRGSSFLCAISSTSTSTITITITYQGNNPSNNSTASIQC
eukprot:gene1576-32961_t